MIDWIAITDRQPNNGDWVLVTYRLHGARYPHGIWCKRIMQWTDSYQSVKRKVTYWTHINPPVVL